MADTKNVRLTGVVTGMVQGVNFRRYTQRHALGLNLTGYVRNLPDGSVEFVAEGTRDDLERLLDLVRMGSPMSAVENVDAQWGAATGEFYHFEIRS